MFNLIFKIMMEKMESMRTAMQGVKKENYEAPLVECLEMELESGCMVSSLNASGNEPWGTESGSWAEQR